MDLQTVSCRNDLCLDKHKVGAGKLRIHCRKDERYYGKTCGERFNYRYETIFYGLKYDQQTVLWAVESGGVPPGADAAVKAGAGTGG
jgi:transposase-like protein